MRFLLSLISSRATMLSLLFLALSSPAGAQSPAAQTFGAWGVECHGDDNAPMCVATQMVAADREGRNVVLGVIMEPQEAGERPLLTFRFTNQVYRPAGAGMKIDDHEPYRAAIAACDEAVCEVRAELGEDMADKMRQGNLLVFAFFLDEDRQMSFPVSLNGFTRALAAVTGD